MYIYSIYLAMTTMALLAPQKLLERKLILSIVFVLVRVSWFSLSLTLRVRPQEATPRHFQMQMVRSHSLLPVFRQLSYHCMDRRTSQTT